MPIGDPRGYASRAKGVSKSISSSRFGRMIASKPKTSIAMGMMGMGGISSGRRKGLSKIAGRPTGIRNY